MSLKRILEIPAVYDLKSRIFSAGRANVVNFLSTLPPLPDNARVLDVGCGTGRHAEIFGERLTGVDVLHEYLTHARTHHPGRFCAMDAAHLGFPDATFDLVYAVGLFHHLDDSNARRAALETRRVLRPGNSALIVDAVRPRFTNPLGLALATLDRGEYIRPVEELNGVLSPTGFTLSVRNLPGSFPYERAVFKLDNEA